MVNSKFELQKELTDKGMVVKHYFDKNEVVGIHAHYPLSHRNGRAVTVFHHRDMELLARHGREKFAVVRYSQEEMNDWLDIEFE